MQIPDYQIFEVEETGARVHMRDARVLLEQICQAKWEEFKSLRKSYEFPVVEKSKSVKDKPVFECKEVETKGKKFFKCHLHLPLFMLPYFDDLVQDLKIKPLHLAIKKKEAEAQVALTGIKILFEKGIINMFLFPNLEKTKKVQNEQPSPSLPKEYKFEERKDLEKDFGAYNEKKKKEKSKAALAVDNSISKNLAQEFTSHQEHLFVYVFKNEQPYPFLQSKTMLGVLLDRPLAAEEVRFSLYPELKQLQKN